MNTVADAASNGAPGARRARPRHAFACIALASALAAALVAQAAAAQAVVAQPVPGAPTALVAPAANANSANGLDAALALQVQQLANEAARAIATRAARRATPGATGADAAAPRVSIEIGRLDPRLRLAPCARVEPYLPEGTRLWGSSRIGLRCTQGTTRWNVYLPVTVKVFAGALVANAAMAAGTVLKPGDLSHAEVDWAAEASGPVADAELAIGRALVRALEPGQGLRQSHLKARLWFAAGDTVAVRAVGNGFSVAGQAQALSNGVEGQAARLRLDNGRVLTGVAIGDRLVEMAL